MQKKVILQNILTNSNIVVIGPMGSGESLWTNNLLNEANKMQHNVHFVTYKDCLRNVSMLRDGHYIHIDKESDINMNFFSDLKDIDSLEDIQLEQLAFIVLSLGKFQEKDIDNKRKEDISILPCVKDAINSAFESKGCNAGMKEVREALIALKNKAHKNGEQNIVNQLVQIIATLKPYSLESGQYFKHFNGASNIDSESDFTVLSIDSYATQDSILNSVFAMIFLQKSINQAIKSKKNMNAKRLIGIDEMWKPSDNQYFLHFLSNAMGIAIKFQFTILISTQTINDFFETSLSEKIYTNSDLKIFLPHNGDVDKMRFDNQKTKKMVANLKSNQFAVVQSDKQPEIREISLSKIDILSLSANHFIRASIENVMQKNNVDLQGAIEMLNQDKQSCTTW